MVIDYQVSSGRQKAVNRLERGRSKLILGVAQESECGNEVHWWDGQLRPCNILHEERRFPTLSPRHIYHVFRDIDAERFTGHRFNNLRDASRSTGEIQIAREMLVTE
jgi:hypothetical protein